ncbi:MAG: thioredoxin [Chloroflexota bacterium]
MSKPTAVDENSFDKEVLKAKTPVLVDFWAAWCGPCRMVAPVVDELADEYDGKVSFVKVDVDQNQKIASQFGIMSIPTLIIFKDGKPVSNIVGFRPKPELKRSLDAALGKG